MNDRRSQPVLSERSNACRPAGLVLRGGFGLSPATLCRLVLSLVFFAGNCVAGPEDGWLATTAQRFKDSDIVFKGSGGNAPVFPLAQASASYYADTEVEGTDGGSARYDQFSMGQYAGLPIAIGQRDALLVGNYLSWTRFTAKEDQFQDFEMLSAGLALGWLHQANPAWQLVGFVMPLGHHNSLEGSDWNLQYVGGAFARYAASETLWWVYGLYFDVSPGEDSAIPYIGASWSINHAWTLNALLPWPSLQYAPNRDWLITLGATASGASWNIDAADGDAGINFDAVDLVLEVEKRLSDNFWLGMSFGVGGLRGLRLEDGSFERPDVDVGSNGYFSLTLNFRPRL